MLDQDQIAAAVAKGVREALAKPDPHEQARQVLAGAVEASRRKLTDNPLARSLARPTREAA